MFKVACYIFISYCLLYSLPSFALAKLGHQLVCQLAYEQLSPKNQQQITQRLLAIPVKEQQRINHYNHLKKNSPITFANACTWADAIKKDPTYKKFKAWHYMNTPRVSTEIIKNSCLENCIAQAIIIHQKQLAAKATPWESTKALLFLGHWLGDIHQPMHVSYASDLGGNKVRFKSKQGRCNNLHSYWDSCIFYLSMLTKKEWLSRLKEKFPKVTVDDYKEDDVWQWANESYQIVIEPSFQYCNIVYDEDQIRHCQRPRKRIQLADNYHSQHLPLLELQLVKAAKRLTLILEASL
jgi:hypothetical protein